jgi:hypothetical protein
MWTSAAHPCARHVDFSGPSLRYCSRLDGPTQKYILERLVHHFESGRAIYRKWKPGTAILFPEAIMHLNLELPLAVDCDIYACLSLEQRILTISTLHGHTTTPLPR